MTNTMYHLKSTAKHTNVPKTPLHGIPTHSYTNMLKQLSQPTAGTIPK